MRKFSRLLAILLALFWVGSVKADLVSTYLLNETFTGLTTYPTSPTGWGAGTALYGGSANLTIGSGNLTVSVSSAAGNRGLTISCPSSGTTTPLTLEFDWTITSATITGCNALGLIIHDANNNNIFNLYCSGGDTKIHYQNIDNSTAAFLAGGNFNKPGSGTTAALSIANTTGCAALNASTITTCNWAAGNTIHVKAVLDFTGHTVTSLVLRNTSVASSFTSGSSYAFLSANASNVGKFSIFNSRAASNGFNGSTVNFSNSIDNFQTYKTSDLGTLSSNSPQNASTGVTLSTTGTAPSGETYYWQTSATGVSTSFPTTSPYTVTTSGNYYLRSYTATGSLWSNASLAIPVTVYPSFVALDETADTKTFTVTNGLPQDIALTAPTGITVSPTTITANTSNVTVTVTYTDKTAATSGYINFTSGGTTNRVRVIASKNTDCFSQVYPAMTNLVTEPYMNSLAAYSYSWGVGTGALITTDTTKVYCGSSCGMVTGTNLGSITYLLAGVWAPNTTYRIKAKVNITSGTFNLNVSGWSGTAADITNLIPVTSGWQDLDFSFTTGSTLGTNQYFYFNNYLLGEGTGYIDNVQMYAVPTSTISGSGNWSDTSKWDYTPVSGSDVIVPTGSVLIIDQSAALKSLTVAPGAAATLNSGKTLSATTFTLQSDATHGTGTFVDNGTTNVSGTSTVQQYLGAARNWYISSPVSGATSLPSVDTGSLIFYSYPENDANQTNGANGYAAGAVWNTVSTGTMALGTGYIVEPSNAASNVTFTGTSLNTGDQPISGLTNSTATNPSMHGYNLIGNPYPSYLNVLPSILNNTNLDPTVWYRTLGTESTPKYHFETVNATTGVGTNNSGTGQVTGYIPPMQAFWVHTNADAQTITFYNANRSHAGNVTLNDGNNTVVPTTLLKSRTSESNAQGVLLRLKVSDGNTGDEAIIYTNANASNGYDNYDSQKMSNNNAAIPEIYTTVGNNQLVINGMNSIAPDTEIPLGFTTGQSNIFSIKASGISNLDSNTKVYLKDNLLSTEQDLTDGTPYTFASDVASTTSRFSVVFKSVGIATGVQTASGDKAVLIYKNANNQIAVNCTGTISSNAYVVVYNALGQKLESKQITSSTTIAKTFNSGVYLVTVNNGGKSTTKKVILN